MVPRDVTAPPRRRARVIQRRRRTFERFLALAVLTFLIGIIPDMRWIWFVHLGVDAGIGLYVWRLIRIKRDDTPVPTEEAYGPEAGRLVKTG